MRQKENLIKMSLQLPEMADSAQFSWEEPARITKSGVELMYSAWMSFAASTRTNWSLYTPATSRQRVKNRRTFPMKVTGSLPLQ